MDSEPFEDRNTPGFCSSPQLDFGVPTGVEFGANDERRTYPTFPPTVAERMDPFRNVGSLGILASYHAVIEAVVIAAKKDSAAFVSLDHRLDPVFAAVVASVLEGHEPAFPSDAGSYPQPDWMVPAFPSFHQLLVPFDFY